MAVIASLATVARVRVLLLGTTCAVTGSIDIHVFSIYTVFRAWTANQNQIIEISQCCMRATVKCTQATVDCYSAGSRVKNNDDGESDVIDYDSKRVFLHHIVRTSARLTFNANATLGDTQ